MLAEYDALPGIGHACGHNIICATAVGGFLAAFLMGVIVSVGGFWANTELSYVIAFAFFIFVMFARPRGLFAR